MAKLAKTVTQRGQSRPPGELARFIEIANLHSGQPLPDPSGVFDAVVRDPSKTVKLHDFWVAECKRIASQLSPKARAFLGTTADVKKFAANYSILYQATRLLHAIANRKWPETQTSKDVSFEQWEAIERARLGLPMCRTSVDLVVDEDGRIKLSKGPVLEALDGERAADRIRSCVICERIFWAPRINSECCSLGCRKTFNMRNSRKNRQYRKSARMKKGH